MTGACTSRCREPNQSFVWTEGIEAMKALIVYESMFGNTEDVAQAIAKGMGDTVEVEVAEVSRAPASPQVPMIVAGGPTHAFSMSRPNTRADAIKQGAPPGREAVGLREWLQALPSGHHDDRLVTFDTRVAKARRLPGSAAKSAAKIARRHGYATETTESFYVHDVSGPLLTGEVERAEAWGRHLGASLARVDR